MFEAELDKPGGPRINPTQYVELQKTRPGHVLLATFCPTCKQQTQFHFSPAKKVRDHWSHIPNENAPPCTRRSDEHDWQSGGTADTGEGDKIRKALADDKQRHVLWTAANVLLREQDADLITDEKFVELAREVNRLGRWDRSGVKLEMVPYMILEQGLFPTGQNASGSVMFTIERSERTGKLEFLPVHETADGKRNNWVRLPIDLETTRELVISKPGLGTPDPESALSKYLNEHPPAWRKTAMRPCKFQRPP